MDKKRDGHTLQTETEGLYLAMAEGNCIWLGNWALCLAMIRGSHTSWAMGGAKPPGDDGFRLRWPQAIDAS